MIGSISDESNTYNNDIREHFYPHLPIPTNKSIIREVTHSRLYCISISCSHCPGPPPPPFTPNAQTHAHTLHPKVLLNHSPPARPHPISWTVCQEEHFTSNCQHSFAPSQPSPPCIWPQTLIRRPCQCQYSVINYHPLRKTVLWPRDSTHTDLLQNYHHLWQTVYLVNIWPPQLSVN